MKNVLLCIGIILSINLLLGCASNMNLKDKYKDYFPLGAAVNAATITSSEDLLKTHFKSLTAENEMKPESIHPRLGKWQFYGADEIADFARDNNMLMRGHTFVWHQQMPGWFFSSMGGPVDRELLLERVKEHMEVMAERYNDVVYAWDVVNEAISDEKEEYLRPSPFLKIIGEDYIDLAFHMAHEIMPEAKLFYNDYSVLDPVKQDKIYKLLSDMIDRGVPVDGIGLQGHWDIYYPEAHILEEAIERFAGLGLDIHITELDVSFFKFSDRDSRYKEPPPSLLKMQNERYDSIFEVLRRNHDKVQAVTFWGVADYSTWLDHFPVKGRKNWPLLFDVDQNPKPAFDSVMDFR